MQHTVNLNIVFWYVTFKYQSLHIFLFNHWVNTHILQYALNHIENFTRSSIKQKLLNAFEIMNNMKNHALAYFLFISDMLLIITKNIFQSFNIINDSVFITVDVFSDFLEEQIELEIDIMIHNRLFICLLMTFTSFQSVQFSELDREIISLHLISESVTQQDHQFLIEQTKLSCISAFAITNYKFQSQTFDKMCEDINNHSSFNHMYVNLSHDKTLKDMFLLWSILKAV